MEICHIITGLNDGGAEAVLYRLVCRDRPERHHVVSLMGPGKYGPMLEDAGTRVSCLEMPRGRITVRGLWQLWRLLRASSPKVLQTWMYHSDLIGGVLGRLSGIPRICWGIHHTVLEPGKVSKTTIAIANINARLSYWIPDAIVCCAERARTVHARLGYDFERLVVIPNGYDLDWFRRQPDARARLRREWGLTDDTFLIGMVGRLNPQKDHSNLIGAISHLRTTGVPFACILVGNGLETDNTEITQLIERWGVSDTVRLLGQRSDIPAIMSALDIHVLSSSAEAFPNVIGEAMACETPCVSTDVGDARIIIGDSGWIVPPQDSLALKDAIHQSYNAWRVPTTWMDRQQAARLRIADNFGSDRMTNAYNSLWNY